MTSAAGRVDEFIKDYLTFRGLSSTLKTLEIELRNEKEKGFRVDKMVDQLHSYILTYDLANLREYWNFLNTRLFSRLEQRYMSSIRKLEVGLLKMYLINASQNNKQDKILDFFERMTELLQAQTEFKEWFAFPFVRNPEDNSHYATYFTKQWQDTFLLSLHNFLSVIMQAMPEPVLLNFESEYRRLRELQEENDCLKQQIISLGEKPIIETPRNNKDMDIKLMEHSHMELVYDFSSLGEDTAIPEPTKSPRKFPFTSSPLNIGKKSDKSGSTTPVKRRDDDSGIKMATMSKERGTKNTKLLPVITRQLQRKSKLTPATPISQSVPVDLNSNLANQNAPSEAVNNQKAPDATAVTNQRHKQSETAIQERKALLEGNASQKPKDDMRPVETKSDVTFSRSVSVPAIDVVKRPPDTRRMASRSVLETKGSSSPKMSRDTSRSATMTTPGQTDVLSPLVSASVAMMLRTGLSNDVCSEEMTTFPPPKEVKTGQQTFPPPVAEGCEPAANMDDTATNTDTLTDIVTEKPFILLSQDEYCEHRSAVSYSRFSNSGQYVASVDVDGVVKIWNWSPEAKTAATVMSKSAFLSLEWASKSDRWLLLGNRSGNIRLFDVREMKSFYEASGDASYPRVVTLCSNPASPTFVCAATTGRARSGSMGSDAGPGAGNKIGKLTLWDLKTMKTERQLPLDPGPVCINSCSFNHNGQLLVSGGVDGIIRLFDTSQQKCISQWEAHKGEIKTVFFSSDYTSCYSLGTDGKLHEWSMHKMNEKLRELPLYAGALPDYTTLEGTTSREVPAGKLMALDNDGEYMLTPGLTNAIIYRISKGSPGMTKLMDLTNPRSSAITTVDWSPNMDTKVCLTGYIDGRVIVSTLLSQ